MTDRTPPLDYDRDQSLILALNAPAKRRDVVNQLQGIVDGICCDGTVSDEEIARLMRFIADHAEMHGQWPFDRIWHVLHTICSDGVVEFDERLLLLRTLREFLLHDPSTKPPQRATGAIFDDDLVDAGEAGIEFVDREFVVTGVLALGKRTPFLKRIANLGAKVHDNYRRTTNYLVVGTKGSEAWISDRYGTKIDAAMQAKKNGSSVLILSEPLVIEAILLEEARRR